MGKTKKKRKGSPVYKSVLKEWKESSLRKIHDIKEMKEVAA